MINQITFQPSTPDNLIQSPGDMVVGKSTLFLFSPRQIVNHYKRPLQYNFNEQMTSSVIDNIVRSPGGGGGVNRVIASTPNIQAAIVPTSTGGFDVHTSKYSDYWMFVLIIDDNAVRNVVMSNKLVTRTILIGICGQEPISHSGLSSMTPEQFLNPNCPLVVTRQLKMTKYATATASGYGNRIVTNADSNIVQYDQDIWNGGQFAGGQSYFTLNPAQVDSLTTKDGEYASSIVRHDQSINTLQHAAIQAELESPKKHITTILAGLENGVSNLNYGSQIGNFGEQINHFDDVSYKYTNAVHDAFTEIDSLHKVVGGDVMETYVQIPMSIAQVMRQYAPKVFPILTPATTQADIIPQDILTPSNLFSSLVSAVLPTYLNAVGLSSIAFMYNSQMDFFQLLDIESALNLPQEVIRHRWDAFTYLIRNELFPVLSENAGPFDLQIRCAINGTVDVILNFLDFDPLPIGAVYQENAVLGGIVSPLVGTMDHLRNNSVQLSHLIANVSTAIEPNIY